MDAAEPALAGRLRSARAPGLASDGGASRLFRRLLSQVWRRDDPGALVPETSGLPDIPGVRPLPPFSVGKVASRALAALYSFCHRARSSLSRARATRMPDMSSSRPKASLSFAFCFKSSFACAVMRSSSEQPIKTRNRFRGNRCSRR